MSQFFSKTLWEPYILRPKPGKLTHDILWIGGWVGHIAGLDAVE
jgi:hypothetical protein